MLKIIRVYAFCPTVADFLLHTTSGKFQPDLVKVVAQLVRAGCPDQSLAGVGQRAVSQLIFYQLQFCPLAFGDVAYNGLQADGATEFDPVESDLNIKGNAIGAQGSPFELLRLASQHRRNFFGGDLSRQASVGLPFRGKVGRRTANNLDTGKPIHAGSLFIAVDETGRILKKNAVTGGFEYVAEFIFALDQPCFELITFSDVMKYREKQGFALNNNWSAIHLYIAYFAVLQQVAPLHVMCQFIPKSHHRSINSLA